MLNTELRLFTEKKLFGRYITNTDIEPLLSCLPKALFEVNIIGQSALGKPIYKIEVGRGNEKVFMWSQMHGNESTTTKSLFDLFNVLRSGSEEANEILDNCKLCIIAILNPDGAKFYTRVNANKVDLNRDAKNLTQPESVVLRKVFNDFKPNYCYNLHGQRTIFGAGDTGKVASVSFLAPSQDKNCTVTDTRKVAMSIIAHMNTVLQEDISGGIGLYDDAYNVNCVGDMFQSENVPTILFEAGHYPNDYDREEVRFLILKSLFKSLLYISINQYFRKDFKLYFDIPENRKNFFDIIVRDVVVDKATKVVVDLAFQYKEVLVDDVVTFNPCLIEIGDLSCYYAHKLIEGGGEMVLSTNGSILIKERAYERVRLGNNMLSLKIH